MVLRHVAFAIGLCAAGGAASAATYSAPGFSETVVATGLSAPTAFAWTPDGRMLVLEKAGKVRVVTGSGLQAAAALDITTRVDSGVEKGLLGICLHPSFASNGFVYLYYTTLVPKNRISRFTMAGNVLDPASESIVLDGIDATNGNHNGGTITIGPDGKLWAAPGDSGTGGAKSQDLSVGSLNGKVLRMELDGSPAAGNPFLGDATKEPRIYAYGFRNPFRFAFRPSNGALFVNDVGQSSREEIDVVTPGGNYGWPAAEGFLGSCTGCIPPVFDYDRTVGGSTIGGTFVTGPVYPTFLRGKYLFADYVSNWIRWLDFDASTNALVGTLQNFASSVEGAVYLAVGPDGYVYYAALNAGRIYRIQPPGIAFYSVAPCRLIDTRNPTGPFGGPSLPAGGERAFAAAGQCGIPSTARSISVNVTVTQAGAGGFVSLYPDGTALPPTSAVNFSAGQTRAGNAILTLSPAGSIRAHCGGASGTVDLVVDVNGYFQ
ncbi:MAG: PQQ-dependent sugar dehydrogenase [Acidobacteriota bacterium]|nr:PQQ-dependent sugar dehydrogenase [Acidobacteriota bacterium]